MLVELRETDWSLSHSSATYWLSHLGQVTYALGASVSSSINWGDCIPT